MESTRLESPPVPALAALDALGLGGRVPAIDSRRLAPGEVFLAYPGERVDGRDYIPQALAAGAAGVLWESREFAWDGRWSVPNAPVLGLREQAGPVAAQAFGNPSHKLWVAGVTGTNGKTSCSHWIAQCFAGLGRPAAVVGTLGSGRPGQLRQALQTTPDPVSLQRELDTQVRESVQVSAVEVSSHALDQGRVNGVRFRVGLFTNLSRDHLDYHGDMSAYGAAKARLFRLPGMEAAVLNQDDPFGMELLRDLAPTPLRLLSYGLTAGDIRGRILRRSRDGLCLEVTTPWGGARLETRLLGAFNAQNLLGVLGVLLLAGVDLRSAVSALETVESVPGRLQRLDAPGRPLVVVDYAHTPDALEKVLETLREVLPDGARLHCVFGCGGERDAGKRPMMGAIAARLAHRVILTSDNPRGEDPLQIISAIRAGAGPAALVEPDRRTAIGLAVRDAAPADLVLVAGKGHETYQEIAGERFGFDDAFVARAALREGPDHA